MLNKRLLELIPKVFTYTAQAVFFQWLSLLCNIAFTISICRFINYCFYNKTFNSQILIETLGITIVSILLRALFTKININITSRTSQQAKKILREKIFDKLCKIGISYKNYISTAEAVQVSVEGIDQLEIYFSQYVPQLFYSIISVVTLFILFSIFSIKVAVIFIVCVPIIPLSIVLIQKFAKRLLSKYWNSYTNLGDTFLENIQGLTTLKIYGCDEQKHIEMNKNAELFRKATMKVLIMQLNSISVMDLVAFGGSAIGIIIGISEFNNGSISLLNMLIIILLSAEFFIPLRQLCSFFHVAMNGTAAADKIFRILDIEDIEIKNNTTTLDDYNICLKNVSFSYDGSRTILNNINITLPNKGLFTLVGKSGCGKSTIASILTGKLKNYSGSIKLGNDELSDISENSLMNMVTYIPHNSYIFKGTIEYNLKMGKNDATKNEMLNVLQKVNLLDFVNSENGLNTEVTEQGNSLSGGQRQRLAIARALLHNTPIYIFDESTSNIDLESEEDIMNVIYELAKEKTVIMISHRLANAINSNNIYVINKGTVIENGTHTKLMEQSGYYAELFNKQQNLENFNKGGIENE